MCFRVGGNQIEKDTQSGAAAAESDAGPLQMLPNWQELFTQVWDSHPVICHVAKREFITLDEADGRSPQIGRINVRPNDAAPQTGLRGVYLPWPYRTDERSSAPDALFWDRLADAVAPGDPQADRRQFCVDLIFRPLTLAPDDLVWEGLSAQLARNRDMNRDRTATADMVGKIYQSYWDLCAQGNLFDFGMRVAGSDAEAVEWLAGSLATAMTGGGRFRVDVLQKGSPEWNASLEAARQGVLDPGFVEPESATWRPACAGWV